MNRQQKTRRKSGRARIGNFNFQSHPICHLVSTAEAETSPFTHHLKRIDDAHPHPRLLGFARFLAVGSRPGG
jgi:hypothetical protein